MTMRTQKIILYAVLWGFVATILLISNTIALALDGVTSYTDTALYHFVASTIWIPVSILLTRFYQVPGRSGFRWLFYGFAFYPLLVAADTLFRSLLRNLFLDVPLDLENFMVVMLTLVDANFLIFGCLILFIFSSVHMLSDDARALRDARQHMDLNVGELNRISSVLPPGFLSRNLDRIINTYEQSFEQGESLMVAFSDFLRLVIYRKDQKAYTLAAEQYSDELIRSYEQYLTCYYGEEIRLAVSELDDIYQIDQSLDNEEKAAAPA